ncbi:MAG: Flp pilus assembly protein CpaB [Comamonadaceae bacterium]|nr:MAG: Flp pilus assembly protein CpaB [Comamonadaceae bacterium]
MSRYTKLLAIILVVLAVILGLVAYRLAVAPKPAPATPPVAENRPAEVQGPRFDVVVASAAVAAGTPLKASDLTVAQWPVRLEQGYAAPDKLVGVTLRRDILAGQPVTTDAVMTGLSRHLEPGQRAVAIAIDEVVGGANQMTPGDYVDVFFLLDKKDEISGTQSRLLQSRLKVLTYGDASIDGPAPDESKANANGPRTARQAPRTATLAVPLDRVNELFLASRTGRLQLALRSPEDEALVDRSLFAERRPVLTGKAGLTPAQKAELELADNKAYAGDSLVQLSDVVTPAAPAPAPRTVSSGGGSGGGAIQVWRGGKPEVVRY